MAKHTPGPWKLSGRGVLRIVGGNDDETVANCATLNSNVRGDIEQRQQANAHLIVAAPELLAACKMAADVIRRTVHEDAVPKAVLEAIARAESP